MQFVPLLAALLTSGAALADNTDIKIHVEYTTSAFRLRPKPGLERATTTLDIVLHPDGKVEDLFSEHGSHARKYGSKDSKLGENKASLTQYRVVDESTVLRTFDDGVLAGSTKIEVKGQGCKATVEFTLNPTLKEHEGYSTELGTKAFYRDLNVLRTKCTIR